MNNTSFLLKKTLFIVNSSGGLIYSTNKDSFTNEAIVLGSTIHSLVEIANEFFRTSSFKYTVEYEQNTIYVFKTPSKIFFIFFWDKNEPPFQAVYLHYAEKIAANYLYKKDMPIKDSGFNPEIYF